MCHAELRVYLDVVEGKHVKQLSSRPPVTGMEGSLSQYELCYRGISFRQKQVFRRISPNRSKAPICLKMV